MFSNSSCFWSWILIYRHMAHSIIGELSPPLRQYTCQNFFLYARFLEFIHPVYLCNQLEYQYNVSIDFYLSTYGDSPYKSNFWLYNNISHLSYSFFNNRYYTLQQSLLHDTIYIQSKEFLRTTIPIMHHFDGMSQVYVILLPLSHTRLPTGVLLV